MKKHRVFQAFDKRRIASGFSGKSPGTILLFLLMAPYLVTFLFGNLREGSWEGRSGYGGGKSDESGFLVSNTTSSGGENIPLEIYVADKLARTVDEDFEPEAMKAQAVLIRSGLLASWYVPGEEGKGREIRITDRDYGTVPVADAIREAVQETAGICLTFEGRPVNGAWFAVSNGATRNARELSLEEYPYLESVPCSRDFLSGDFVSMVSIKKDEFTRIWQQLPETAGPGTEFTEKAQGGEEKALEGIELYRDSAGYVLYLLWKEKWVTGEQFRESFHLPSASFQMSEEDGEIFFTVKGVGHGLGMSQFAAGQMAAEGQDYVEILNYFFRNVTFTKFE